MELQELVIRAVISQMRFRLAPRFIDVRGGLIEDFRDEFGLTEYGWGESHLQVYNTARTRSLVAGASELRLVFEHLERVDDYLETGRSFFATALERLGVVDVQFLGVRSYWMAAVDSFEELVGWMAERFSPGNPVTAATGSKLTDIGWFFEFREKDPKLTVRAGPMEIDQFLEQIIGSENRDLYPDAFLFVDIDRVYNEEPIAADDVVARWEDSFKRELEIGERLGGLLNGDTEAPAR